MNPGKPLPDDVLRAADIFLRLAYPNQEVPVTVRAHISVLRSWKGDFYRSPAIAGDKEEPDRRFSLRLGNYQYPHMKLAIERAPAETGISSVPTRTMGTASPHPAPRNTPHF